MRRAIELARQGVGRTRPNPPVGAVVVRKGCVVGEGYHRHAGGPHAEIYALRQAGSKARGAVLYVTLEPCSTWGRTPPCTEAILQAGIRKVVAALSDPNPRHAGRGFRWLRTRGIDVAVGICRREAAALIEPFAKWIRTGVPWVTLKMAMSLDGRIADRRGRSKWITGRAARHYVHELRRSADAVLVGAATVAADNPSLLPRPAFGHKPFRVVVDSMRAHAPLASQVFNDESACRTILVVPRGYPQKRLKILRKKGVSIWEVRGKRRVELGEVLLKLGRLGLLHVMCEGGGKLAASLCKQRLVDSFVLFYGPKLLGDPARPMLAGAGWLLNHAPEFSIVQCEKVGLDALVIARPRGKD